MARQPYLSIAKHTTTTALEVGILAIGKRPALELMVGGCLLAWPNVEAEMALFLGRLLGMDRSAGVLAVFHALRRSSSQREAIQEAAKVTLEASELELLSAVLAVHKSIEADRNALAHGHFGVASTIPDGLLWMKSQDYVALLPFLENANLQEDLAARQHLLSHIWVYRADDLRTMFNQIRELAEIWLGFTSCIRLPNSDPRRAQGYRLLCGQRHIARELEKLRRGRTPPTPNGSPESTPSGES